MSALWSEALTRALLDFQGKSTEALERFAAANPVEAELVAALCDVAAGDDAFVQGAATWLLKRYGVTGADLTPRQRDTLLRALLQETSWLARLHVLQMMESLVIPAALAEDLMPALEALSRGDNKFIRAWSAHGAAVLADQHPQYRARFLDLLAEARGDAAPSVRARLRKTSGMFDWI